MAKKAEKEEPKLVPKEIVEQEGEITVHTTVVGQKSSKRETIKVRPFATTPAQVEVHYGAWFPTGDMQGAKVDISVRMPCYAEEVPRVYRDLKQWVDSLIAAEVARLQGETLGD